MIYAFLADGFEDVEALAPIDILRRAGLEVQMVSINADTVVTSAHGVKMIADTTIDQIDFSVADLLFLPGGLPGSTNLDACETLRQGILQHYQAGKLLAAICAAPLVFGHLGILAGVKATCYPGVESELKGADYTAALVQCDGQFITGKGPGAAMEFGYTILEVLGHEQAAAQLREGMMYNFLMHG